MKLYNLLTTIVALAIAPVGAKSSFRGLQVSPQGSSDDADLDIDIRGCFSPFASVQVLDKGTVLMKNLQVGDKVLTTEDDQQYHPVYAFAHKEPERIADFLQIHTNQGQQALEITGEHLVFVHGKRNPVRADSIKNGDVLQTVGGVGGGNVTGILAVKRQGLYAPLTPNGKLVVDGIQASAYIALQETNDEYLVIGNFKIMPHQSLLHAGLSPLRLMCKGLTSELCQPRGDNGMPQYVTLSLRLVDWVESCNALVQLCHWSLASIFFAASMMLESILMMCTPLVAILMLLVLTTRVVNVSFKDVTFSKKKIS